MGLFSNRRTGNNHFSMDEPAASKANYGHHGMGSHGPNTVSTNVGHHGMGSQGPNALTINTGMQDGDITHSSGYHGIHHNPTATNTTSGHHGMRHDQSPPTTAPGRHDIGMRTSHNLGAPRRTSRGLGGLLGRRRNDNAGVANMHGRTGRRGGRYQNEKFDINSGNYNRRPSFGQWLKFTWLDILTMTILGATGLGVYNAHPMPSRSFPVYFQDGEIVYPQFAYPLRHEIIPIWLAALLGSLIPIFIILCMQIRIRSFWDANNALIGLLYALISAAVFQVFLKWLIGGLRPHFLTVCQPVIPNDGAVETGTGLRGIMYDRSICTGDQDQIDDSLESFPSGHSTAAWAGFAFLYFYLNAKLKVFSNHHPAMWKLVAAYAPLLAATLISGSLTIDEYHNWYDCLAGAIIGLVMAISAYRMVYASVWDFRFNHIPLTRHTPFSYGAGEAGAGGFERVVFTRAAGWGYEEAYGGAPFDAPHGRRGAQPGFGNHIHNDGASGVGTHHGHQGGSDGGLLGQQSRGENYNTTGDHFNNRTSDHYNATDANHNKSVSGSRNTTTGDQYNNTGSPGIMGSHAHGRDTGYVEGNQGRVKEPTTPTRDSKYRHSGRSLERKALRK